MKAQERASQPTVPETPKIVITAGAATHAVGPTYNLTETNDSDFISTESPSSSSSPSAYKKPEGIIGDMIEDLGIPPEVFQARPKAAAQEQFPASEKTYERPMDKSEKNGLVGFLGIFVGTYIAAGIFGPANPKEPNSKPTDVHH